MQDCKMVGVLEIDETITRRLTYDNLDRLDTVLFNNTVSRMEFDMDGNMMRRTSQGTVLFKNASVDSQVRPHAVTGAEVNSAMLPEEQTVLYTMHDKVKRIEQGDDYLSIDYGYDRQRIGITEWIEADLASTHKLYVGSCEFNRGLSREQRLTYISGPLGVFAVYEQLGELYKGGGDSDDSDDDGGDEDSFTGALYYLHRDHLGSVTTITNSSGAIVQELSYDAWGNLRNPYTWSGSFTGTPKFDRGFTGHEHHSHFGLINMNGRMYDPLMCSFLSVDTYVQDPGNAQNFNRYAYCLNNPLKYVDPSGEFIWVIPNIGYSKDGGLSFGLTFAVGLPGLWSAQASVGYATGSQSIYGSVGATFAGVTAYASAGYSFQNEQVSASLGITAGLSPYSGVPVSTNFLTVGASCDFTFSKTGGTDVSFTGQLSAWSYNSSSKDWHYNPSVSVMVFPEHTTNFFRGQGFRSNDKVLQRFVSNNQHQQALNYFGFEGKYDANCPDPGYTDRIGLTITYGDQAFANGYDYLYLTADHEQKHLANFRSNKYEGFDGPLDDITHAEEEWSTYMYNYKRHGLYPRHGINLRDRVEKEGIGAGVYDIITVCPNGCSTTTGFAPKWWHFVYYIPRLY